MKGYDRWGNRPKGAPDPINAPAEANLKFDRSRLFFQLSSIPLILSFIVPLFKPLMSHDAQVMTDILTSNTCKGIEVVGIGYLGFTSFINGIRARRATRNFNRAEAQRKRDEISFLGHQ